jgi:hypothetical protein
LISSIILFVQDALSLVWETLLCQAISFPLRLSAKSTVEHFFFLFIIQDRNVQLFSSDFLWTHTYLFSFLNRFLTNY